jgi:hypothetical protein
MRLIRLFVPIAAVLALMAVAAPSFAKHGGANDGRVVKTGDCSGASNFKLKAKPDNGKLEVEFEVDQNKAGVKWNYRIRRNGKSVASGSRRTKAPSGSFSVQRRIANPAGKDKVSAVAKRASGETCRASLKI